MSFKLITLDLDDTLWPVEPVLAHAEQVYHDFLRQAEPGLFASISIDDMRQYRLQTLQNHPELQHDISRWRRDSLCRQLCESGLDETRAHALSAEAFDVFLAARQAVTLFPGAEQALAELAKHFTLVAVTNGNADVTRMPIGVYFTAAFRAEEVGVSKPAPEIFEAALAAVDCSAADTLHIGDDPFYDIEAARAMGIATLQAAITGKHPAGEPAFDDWQSVPAMVRELSEARE